MTATLRHPHFTAQNIYIAGPMRGIPEFNFPAFFDAADRLRDLGHFVRNPAETDADRGFEWEGLTGHENLTELGFDLPEALAGCLEWICTAATRIVVLPGWETSRGARAEVATATALGIEVHELEHFVRWGVDAQDLTSRDPETGPPHLTVAPPIEHDDDEHIVTSATGGQKGRKPAETGAVDPVARNELALVAGFGSRKYHRGNYLLGLDWSLNIDALHRHMIAFESGENRDPESGFLHTAHVAWHALALTSFALRNIGTDDRFQAATKDNQ